MATLSRLQTPPMPTLFTYGFRPFFLFGALYGGLAILVWSAMFGHGVMLPTHFGPIDFHIHSMLYGFLPAVIAGFLLTAVPNWTGRKPISGAPLAALFALWLAGRGATIASDLIGWQLAMAIDLGFLAALALVIGREIVLAGNTRNLKVVAVLAALLVGNGLFHWEAATTGMATYGTRIGIIAGVFLVMLIGGRIIPAFTRNWLTRENSGRLPVMFNRFDLAAILVALAALALWSVMPQTMAGGVLLIVAAGLHLARLLRWAGDRTFREPLLAVLHVAYLFIPVGLLLLGLSVLDARISPSAGLHALTGGAFGVMPLAVMARASLGHTGKALTADRATVAVFAGIVAAVLLRIAAALMPEFAAFLQMVAAFFWAAAMLGFAVAYGRLLILPRAA
ncbi:MAG: NnrS family protein [Salinarimonas sp.]|nr:NnrS family protein [Salinarimonas sp.]